MTSTTPAPAKRPRPRCKGCGGRPYKGHPLVNFYCSNACATSAILSGRY
jgi:hypothetical protein